MPFLLSRAGIFAVSYLPVLLIWVPPMHTVRPWMLWILGVKNRALYAGGCPSGCEANIRAHWALMWALTRASRLPLNSPLWLEKCQQQKNDVQLHVNSLYFSQEPEHHLLYLRADCLHASQQQQECMDGSRPKNYCQTYSWHIYCPFFPPISLLMAQTIHKMKKITLNEKRKHQEKQSGARAARHCEWGVK